GRVRPGARQGLPAPDLLRHTGRGEAHLMASLPPIDLPTGATGKGSFDAPTTGEVDFVRFDYLLRLGDDSLILGQRLSEWCGHAPVLGVGLRLENLSLDPLG